MKTCTQEEILKITNKLFADNRENEGASDKNISVTYRYNIAGKEYESNKVQYTEKIKKGDKKEIRVKKNNPEVILEYNDINFVVLLDVVIGLCLELTVLCLYEMATNGLIFLL